MKNTRVKSSAKTAKSKPSNSGKFESMTVFDQIKTGLESAIAQTRGQITLRKTKLPAASPTWHPKAVVATRKKVGLSQSVFASYLNVPVKTLQSWEQGLRQPKASEARLLQIARSKPEIFTQLIETVSH